MTSKGLCPGWGSQDQEELIGFGILRFLKDCPKEQRHNGFMAKHQQSRRCQHVVHGMVGARGKKGRLRQVTWHIRGGGHACGGQARERAVCVKVWNRAIFFSPDVAHSRERGLFLPVL